jgi:hypothetical protein
MVISRIKAISPVPEEEKKLLADVERLTVTPAAEKNLRLAEDGILNQIVASRKGKAYLSCIAALRSYTPVLDTAITTEAIADQRRRAIALQLLHQFLLAEAVPLSKILAVRIDDPEENPFMPTHKVEAFAKVLDRWALTFHIEDKHRRHLAPAATPVATAEPEPAPVEPAVTSQSEVAAVVANEVLPDPLPVTEAPVKEPPLRQMNGQFAPTKSGRNQPRRKSS